ncbi:hypothetical protein D3C73_205400 [compost metagenome]
MVDGLNTDTTLQHVHDGGVAFVVLHAEGQVQFSVETSHAGLDEFLDAIQRDRSQVTNHVVQLRWGWVTIRQLTQGRVAVDRRDFFHHHGIRQRSLETTGIDVFLHLASQLFNSRQDLVAGDVMQTGH